MNDLFTLFIYIGVLLILIKFLIKWLLIRLIGQHAFNEMVGILAADVIRFLFLAPFKLLRWIAQQIGRI